MELAVIMVAERHDSSAVESGLGADGSVQRQRGEPDSVLRDVTEALGGRVVGRPGGGLLAVFPSVTAALDGAVALQQQLERRSRGASHPVPVGIGISIGDASLEDGDPLGIAPTEAAGLAHRAPDREILVADSVRAVARNPGDHVLEPVEMLVLDGLPDPVAAWKLLWTPLPDSTGPVLPARLRGASDAAYVGRSRERAVLLDAWARAAAGARQVVFISGEPGIGKTTLVTQTARTALPDDALILYGRCDEDQGMPYYPWLEILRDCVEVVPRRLLAPHAGELSRLVPGLAEKLLGVASPPAGGDPETERYRLFDAVGSLFAAAAGLAPLLVVLDDLHWADRPTLLLLRHLVRVSSTRRLMLLGTYRDSDVAAEHPLTELLADLEPEADVTRLALSGLDETEILNLIDEMTGHSIDSTGLTLATEVHGETAGNPFFIGELVRHLSETGAISRQADGRSSFQAAAGARRLPASVREVIEQRVARLGARAHRVLSAGAVIGGDFDFELVARAARLPPPAVLDVLEAAMAASLLTRTAITRASFVGPRLSEVYAFSHGLVHATLYDALPSGRRAILHQAVAEAIEEIAGAEEIDGRLAELAHHYLAAGPVGDGRRAVDYAARAGEQAMRQFAYERAAALFAGALGVTGAARAAGRLPLLQSLGEAQMRAGDSQAARRTLLEAADLARRHDDPQALARATRACGIWGLSAGVDDVLVGLAEEAIERLEGSGSPRLLAEIKGLLAAALYYAPAGEAARRERLAAEALAGARAEHRRAGDRESMASLAYVLGRCLAAGSGPDAATRDFPLSDELLDLSRRLGDVELELLGRQGRTTMFLELGDFPALGRELARIEQMAIELRQPRAMVFLPLHRGVLAVTAGRFADAERLNAESVEIGRGIPGSLSGLAASTQLLLIRLQQGRLPELEPQVRGIVGAYPDIIALRCTLVLLLLQAARPEEARAEFERVVGSGLAALPRDNTHIVMLALLAEAAAELRDEARAAELYRWLDPYQGRWVVLASTFVLWPVDRSLGRLAGVGGSSDLALSHLAGARRQAEDADALPSLARIALDEARILAGRAAPGDGARAARLAADARRLAERVGMAEVSRAAAALSIRLVPA